MTVLDNVLELKIEYMIPQNKEVEEAIENKFLTPSKFAQEIERIVQEENVNYIEGICHFCELNNFDIEAVAKLIPKTLKEKLKHDAVRLNYIKQTTKAVQLPFV